MLDINSNIGKSRGLAIPEPGRLFLFEGGKPTGTRGQVNGKWTSHRSGQGHPSDVEA